MATTIPVPLRSGEYTLSHGTYTGDIGGTDEQNQPILNIKNHSTVTATVVGFGEPLGTGSPATLTHYATFNVKGSDTLDLTQVGGGRLSTYGPGDVTVNLAPHATLTASFDTTLDGFVTVNGDDSARLRNLSGTDEGSETIDANVVGTGTVTLNSGEPGALGALTLDGKVGPGETIVMTGGDLELDKPMRFLGTIDWGSSPASPLQTALFADTTADSYTYDGSTLRLFEDNKDFLNIHLTNPTNAPLYVVQTSAGVGLASLNPDHAPGIGTALPIHTS